MIKYCFLSASYMAGNRSKSYPFFPSSISKPYPLLKRTTNGQEQELTPICHLLMPNLAGAKVHVFSESWLGLEGAIRCNLGF